MGMKVVILAGGYGTRLSEETSVRPKPMVEIGSKPMIWHIMKLYSAHGINDFIVCCGYKGEVIREYFATYFMNSSDVTFDLLENRVEVHRSNCEPWKVTLLDTGDRTMTGGRIKRVQSYIGDEPFCMTYGDGVSDVNINKLIEFHCDQKALATLTAVQPPGRFGAFQLEAGQTRLPYFKEKPKGDNAWINGGFFVLEPGIFDYIQGDDTVWENEPMQKIAERGLLAAYQHEGYWQNMDTLRDKNLLENLWQSGNPPWKVW
jgi:glucose-1-phosphate cytidylyltransferase